MRWRMGLSSIMGGRKQENGREFYQDAAVGWSFSILGAPALPLRLAR